MISQKILRPERTSQFILQEALYHTQAVKIKAVRVAHSQQIGSARDVFHPTGQNATRT